MPQNSQSSPWQFDAQATYAPISFEGTIVGFCKADVVKQVVSTLNNAEKLQKALALACYDLIAREGGNTDSVGELAQQYLRELQKKDDPIVKLVYL
jgi:hypothetical protein